MMTPGFVRSTGRAYPTAAAMIWPGVVLVMAAYAVGTRAPGLIWGRSTMSTSGGTMLETLMRLTLPMPAARSALSNAFSAVPPSAAPAVAATFVTFFQIIATSFSLATAPASRFSSGVGSRGDAARVAVRPEVGPDDTGPKLKRKHFFLASLSSCSIIQANFAPVSKFFRKRSRTETSGAQRPGRRRREWMIEGRGLGRGEGVDRSAQPGSSPAVGAARLQLRDP